MPIQTIGRSPNLGENLFSAPEGLSQALSELANYKVQKIQHQQAAKNLHNAFPELPESALSFLASQPPKERLQYLSQYTQGLPLLQQQQQMQNEPQEQLLQQLLEQQQQSSVPYAPGFKGKKQQQFGGQQQADQQQQIQQVQQQLAQPKQKPSFGKAFSQPSSINSKISPVVDPKKQLQIDKSNAKFLDKMTEYVSSASRRKALAQEALDLVKSGKVTNGLAGLLPEYLLTSLSDENAKFVTLVGQLANEKALELRGPVGKAKIEAAQRTKASLNQPKEAQESILEREIKESSKAEALAQAYEEILAENNNVQPPDIETKIRKRAHEIERNEGISEDKVPDAKQSKLLEKLPKASELPGKRVRFPDGSIRKSNGKEWVKE